MQGEVEGHGRRCSGAARRGFVISGKFLAVQRNAVLSSGESTRTESLADCGAATSATQDRLSSVPGASCVTQPSEDERRVEQIRHLLNEVTAPTAALQSLDGELAHYERDGRMVNDITYIRTREVGPRRRQWWTWPMRSIGCAMLRDAQ